MADEPRRSGRATKGQHKNLEPAETPKPKKQAATAPPKKGNKKSAEPEPEPEAEDDGGDDDDDIIRCVCGDTSDDEEGRKFIACEACGVWQHNVCMGLPLEDDALPDHYHCERCFVEGHKDLLEAMARGEKPWEDRIRAHAEHLRQERNRKKAGKRKSKGARQSRVSDVRSEVPSDQVSASPAPAPAPVPAPSQDPAQNNNNSSSSSNKRKFEEEPVVASSPAGVPAAAAASASTPAPVPGVIEETRRGSSAAAKRRKSEAEPKQHTQAAPPAQQKQNKADAETAVVPIEQLPKDRQSVASRLAKILGDGTKEKVTAGEHTLKDGETTDSLASKHASLIEYELYQVHGAPKQPQYSSQFRALDANLRKNKSLVQRLLDGSLTAHALATMATQDMASEELQRERQQLKEEADKQAVMIRDEDEDKPRVRRTHKGDEYIDDHEASNHESVFTSQPVRSREVDGAEKPPAPPVAEANATAGAVAGAAASPDRMDIDKTDATRRQSQQQQFDINNVWAKTHDSEQQTQPARRRSSFNKTPQEKGEKNDADVDRLLADDDDDQEYAPQDAAGVVWRGLLVQPGVTEFTACARYVAGADFSQFMKWEEFLPPGLEIEGRLESKRADDYLCGLQWSKKSDVSVLALTPYDNREAFDQVYEYFATRQRYAVIRKGHGMTNIVKDVYITPVGPGNRLPPHLELLAYNTLDAALPERMLIVTFVVNKPPHWDNPVVDTVPAVASPLNGHGPQFSPRPAQGFTPMQNGHTYPAAAGAIPPNPYSGTPPQNYTMPQSYPPPHHQPHPNPTVERILGPLSSSPVVAAILAAAGADVQEHVLVNMRDILAADPAAREDLGVFYQRLGTQQG